jgi:hypothetical protein
MKGHVVTEGVMITNEKNKSINSLLSTPEKRYLLT